MIKEKFIRLSPTVLFHVPKCYGNYNVRCAVMTGPCPVEHSCIVNQPTELIEVKKDSYLDHEQNNRS